MWNMYNTLAKKVIHTAANGSELKKVIDTQGDEHAITICIAYLNFGGSEKNDKDYKILNDELEYMNEVKYFEIYKKTINTLIETYFKANPDQ